MKLFYSKNITGETITLDPEESRHCTKVLRLSEGDEIFVANGEGTLFKAKITFANINNSTAHIVETIENYGKRDFNLQIAVAPTKNTARIEWFLEKATEIGIDNISLIECEHSERVFIKVSRFEKIILSAMKQSLKATLPKLNEPIKFDTFISGSFPKNKYIAHCAEENDKKHLKNLYKNGDAIILIGPEGDFSENEIRLAKSKGFIPISLGNSRLRSETAALAACHIINLLND
jgi:16S rRNA (uracil1498-N3)-methyltransferase